MEKLRLAACNSIAAHSSSVLTGWENEGAPENHKVNERRGNLKRYSRCIQHPITSRSLIVTIPYLYAYSNAPIVSILWNILHPGSLRLICIGKRPLEFNFWTIHSNQYLTCNNNNGMIFSSNSWERGTKHEIEMHSPRSHDLFHWLN